MIPNLLQNRQQFVVEIASLALLARNDKIEYRMWYVVCRSRKGKIKKTVYGIVQVYSLRK